MSPQFIHLYYYYDSATIGGVGELASQGYEYDPLVSTGKVVYSADMGGLSGYVSAGINSCFDNDGIAGTFTSGVAAASLGGVDFGVRQIISATTTKSNTSTGNKSAMPMQSRTSSSKHRRTVPRNYVMALY